MTRALPLSLLLLALVIVPVAASDDLVPAELGGAPARVSASGGLELVASLDHTDPRDMERLDELKTLLAVTGLPADGVSVAAAYPAEGASGGWVSALRVGGADGAVLQALVLAGLRADLESPSQERAQVADKTVELLTDAASPADQHLAFYGRGDTVWLVGGTDDEIAAILGQLP